ncbi:MAG: RluA family pseudouridine synthase [Oscillospiraceae bacterium]|nr:RluA family pseudouridine synthase [Oscillospiraceae bacterium]
MRSFVIGANDSGQRLDKFIAKAVPKLPKSLMHKYIRKKRIKLNSKRCEANAMLEAGDVIELYISDEFFSANKSREEFELSGQNCDIDVIYEDENIALIYKKAEIACHSGNKKESDTLVNRFVAYLTEKGDYDPFTENSFRPALCNRLDKNTCGIVIGAKNAAALREINAMIRDDKVCKEYLCICVGNLPKSHDIIKAFLRKDSSANKVYITDRKVGDAKNIVTEYTVLDQKDDLRLVSVRLHTGRTHQIRAHMAYIGAPVLGDVKYGDIAANKRHKTPYQSLCAYKISFDFEKESALSYLNNMYFEIDNIWFLNRYFK